LLQSANIPAEGSEAAVLGAVLATAGLALVPFALALARSWWPERRVFFARWGFGHLALLVICAFVASSLVAIAWPLESPDEDLALPALLWRMGLIYALLSLALVRIVQRVEPNPRLALGCVSGGTLRAMGGALLLYLILLPGLMGVTFFWPALLQSLGHDVLAQDVLLGLLKLEGAELWLCFVAATCVMPFFEELLFRGFLQPLLVQNFNDKGGVVLTSIAFAALHGATAFLPIFALSLILGGVMLRTRRLACAWAVHAAHNALMILLALNLPIS